MNQNILQQMSIIRQYINSSLLCWSFMQKKNKENFRRAVLRKTANYCKRLPMKGWSYRTIGKCMHMRNPGGLIYQFPQNDMTMEMTTVDICLWYYLIQLPPKLALLEDPSNFIFPSVHQNLKNAHYPRSNKLLLTKF